MTYIAFKVPVVESEANWGRKIDDYMVCLTFEDSKEFEKEFNSKNTETVTLDWYMQVEGEPESIMLNQEQFKLLVEEKRVWWSRLRNIL